MKCRIVIAGNGTVTDMFIKRILSDDRFHICGYLPCPTHKDYSGYYNTVIKDAPILSYDDLDKIESDMIFALEYRKLIPSEVVKNYLFINCHAGILPKYRGFSSNAWAIMNGEKYIGFSIHRMNEKMDDGELYYVRKIPIDYKQTYSDVHYKMIMDIMEITPDILVGIFTGSVEGKKQEGDRIYGHRFSRDIGLINDFNVNSMYIYNLYRCMAKPLGTGIKILHDGIEYEVNSVINGKDKKVCDYVGIPGRVVNIEDDSLWVKTSDNVIVLGEICKTGGEKVDLCKTFKIGHQI